MFDAGDTAKSELPLDVKKLIHKAKPGSGETAKMLGPDTSGNRLSHFLQLTNMLYRIKHLDVLWPDVRKSQYLQSFRCQRSVIAQVRK